MFCVAMQKEPLYTINREREGGRERGEERRGEEKRREEKRREEKIRF
jgi:hypothetical protein